MPFSMLDMGKLDEYMEFYMAIYPDRDNPRERFIWQCVENPFLEDKDHPYVLLYCKDGMIVGQSLLNPFRWHFRGRDRRDYLGIDWYVLEKYRGAVGTALAIRTIRDRQHYFGIGFSEVAESVWRRLGVRTIGSIKIFIWFRNPLKAANLLKGLLKKPATNKGRTVSFPEAVESGRMRFSLVRDPDFWKERHWKDTLEFSRSREFLRWRFFDSIREYRVYSSDDHENPAYFVVRESSMRGLSLLVLVDYRIRFRHKEAFDGILGAAKRIARDAKLDGIVTGSSHSFFDSRLKRRLFFDTRKSGLIMTNAGLDIQKKAIMGRDAVYVTMADSDLELVQF